MSTDAIPQPFVLNKDLGRPLEMRQEHFTQTNAEGLPAEPMTQEQKYLFDTKGWVLIPGVLDENEIVEMRDFLTRLQKEPESILEHERNPLGGPTQRLVDHPVILGFAHEFIYTPFSDGRKGLPLGSEQGYGFRCENCSYRYRVAGEGRFGPHNGNGMMRLPGDLHTYHCFPGRANAGLTRAIWELNPVGQDDGGTILISGSHKAAFTAPDSVWTLESCLWETYSCPAGSVLLFTEAITHSAQPWKSEETDRVAVLCSYNNLGSKWHDWEPDPRLVAAMPAKRQSLFRPVHVSRNRVEA